MMKALPPAMSKQGGGLAKFVGNPSAITKAMDLPASQQTLMYLLQMQHLNQ